MFVTVFKSTFVVTVFSIRMNELIESWFSLLVGGRW